MTLLAFGPKFLREGEEDDYDAVDCDDDTSVDNDDDQGDDDHGDDDMKDLLAYRTAHCLQSRHCIASYPFWPPTLDKQKREIHLSMHAQMI